MGYILCGIVRLPSSLPVRTTPLTPSPVKVRISHTHPLHRLTRPSFQNRRPQCPRRQRLLCQPRKGHAQRVHSTRSHRHNSERVKISIRRTSISYPRFIPTHFTYSSAGTTLPPSTLTSTAPPSLLILPGILAPPPPLPPAPTQAKQAQAPVPQHTRALALTPPTPEPPPSNSDAKIPFTFHTSQISPSAPSSYSTGSPQSALSSTAPTTSSSPPPRSPPAASLTLCTTRTRTSSAPGSTRSRAGASTT